MDVLRTLLVLRRFFEPKGWEGLMIEKLAGWNIHP